MLDRSLAGLTVELSRLAYRSESRARDEAASLDLTDFNFHSRPPNEVLSASDDDRLYVAFRGTDAEVIDWVQNAEFRPTRGELATRVHSGFHTGLDDLWEHVHPIVEAAAKPVVLTGHSLGGALAVLAAARLHEAGHVIAAVHTYGQPRVGLGDFRAAYGDRLDDVTYRFINHIDIVTRVPLLLQGYRHTGRRVYFDAGGSPHVDAGIWWVAWEDVKFRVTHFGRIRAAGLAPHLMSAYVDLVDGL